MRLLFLLYAFLSCHCLCAAAQPDMDTAYKKLSPIISSYQTHLKSSQATLDKMIKWLESRPTHKQSEITLAFKSLHTHIETLSSNLATFRKNSSSKTSTILSFQGVKQRQPLEKKSNFVYKGNFSQNLLTLYRKTQLAVESSQAHFMWLFYKSIEEYLSTAQQQAYVSRHTNFTGQLISPPTEIETSPYKDFSFLTKFLATKKKKQKLNPHHEKKKLALLKQKVNERKKEHLQTKQHEPKKKVHSLRPEKKLKKATNTTGSMNSVASIKLPEDSLNFKPVRPPFKKVQNPGKAALSEITPRRSSPPPQNPQKKEAFKNQRDQNHWFMTRNKNYETLDAIFESKIGIGWHDLNIMLKNLGQHSNKKIKIIRNRRGSHLKIHFVEKDFFIHTWSPHGKKGSAYGYKDLEHLQTSLTTLGITPQTVRKKS